MRCVDMSFSMSWVYYDQTPIEGRLAVQQLFEDVIILDRNLSWERLIDKYEDQFPFPYLICSLVGQTLIIDRRQKGFPLGWAYW